MVVVGSCKDVSAIYHFVVARHVALVQVSSARCERVFAQVTLMCETCGVNPLESTLATSVMEQVNRYNV